MDGIAESHLIDENFSDWAFPENAGFRMPLEGMVKRDNIFVFVQPLTKLAETPIADGVINLQEPVDGWWRGLLVGVFNITKCNVAALIDSHCNECLETWQFNAAGVSLHQHAQPRGSTLGTIKACTRLTHAVCLDKSCPHQTEDLGWFLG